MKMRDGTLTAVAALAVSAGFAGAADKVVEDKVISLQRAALAESTKGAGFGPQAPRDIDTLKGMNSRFFQLSPPSTQMNLCNIHFHESAEHKGGEFSKFAGNGDGKGSGTGYLYSGELTDAEKAPYANTVGAGKYGELVPGDTIEVHFVHTSAQVVPGPTLGSCLSESIGNPQLRVEAQVYVLVNDESAVDFAEQAKVVKADGFYQAAGIPSETGSPIEYTGSTTGPGYNEKGSPFQVSWSVRPKVQKVSIQSVEAWLGDNPFDETAAHGVRNLVTNLDLLSKAGL